MLPLAGRCNNPRPGDNPVALEQQVESLAEQLAAANPTADAALSPLLLGAWALLYSGRSARLAAAAGMPAAAGPTLQQALQATSDRLYNLFYQCELTSSVVSQLASWAVRRSGRRGEARWRAVQQGKHGTGLRWGHGCRACCRLVHHTRCCWCLLKTLQTCLCWRAAQWVRGAAPLQPTCRS